jgi:hypothetical protein
VGRLLKEKTLPCGCKYEDHGFLLVRVFECEEHRKQRTKKKEFRPKAECVRAGSAWD